MTADLEALRPKIAAICERFRVRHLDVFGSAVDPQRFEPDRSDVDLLVEFAALPTGTYVDHYFGLQEALAGLFGRPVDLVVERAIRNPYFRESIEASRQRLYAA